MRILWVLLLSVVWMGEARPHEMWTKGEAQTFGVAQTDNWVSGKTNPITGLGCCGLNDCRPIAFDAVDSVRGGWVIRGTGEFVPEEETQPAEDVRHWLCRYGYGKKKGQIRCFFPAGGGV